MSTQSPPPGTLVTPNNFVPGEAVVPSADFCWGPAQRARATAGGMRLVAVAPNPGWCEVRFADGIEQQYRIGAQGAMDLQYGTEAAPLPEPIDISVVRPELDGVPVTADNFVQHAEVTAGPHWRWGTQHTDNDDDSGVGMLLRLDPDTEGWALVRWAPSSRSDSSYRAGFAGATDLVYGRQQKQLPIRDPPAELDGKDVSLQNAVPGYTVSRGRNWRREYALQDGGKPGVLSRIHEGHAYVLWQDNTENRYRCVGGDHDQLGEGDDGADLCYGSNPASEIEVPRVGANGVFSLCDRWKSCDVVGTPMNGYHVIGVHSRNSTSYSEEVFDAETSTPVDCVLVVSELKTGIAALGIMKASHRSEACSQHIIGEVEIFDSVGLGIEPTPQGGKAYVLCSDEKKYAREHNASGCTVIHMRVHLGQLSFKIDGHPFHCPELAQRRHTGDWRVGVSVTQAGQRGFFCSGPESEPRAKMFVDSLITFPRAAFVPSQQQQQQQQQLVQTGTSTPRGGGGGAADIDALDSNSPNADSRRQTESAVLGSSISFHDFLRSIDVLFDRALVCRMSQRATVFSVQVFDAGAVEFEEQLTIHGGLRGGDVAFGFVDEAVTADAARFLCGETELVRSMALLIRPAPAPGMLSVCFLHKDKLVGGRVIRRQGGGGDEQDEEGEDDNNSIEVRMKFSRGNVVFTVDGTEDFVWSEAQRLSGSYRLAVSLTTEGQRASLAGVDNELVEQRLTSTDIQPQDPPAELVGKEVTPDNFRRGMFVTRSSSWKFGDQDGRAPGYVFALENNQHAWVRWPASNSENRYRCTAAVSDLIYGKVPAATSRPPKLDPSRGGAPMKLVDRWRSIDCSPRGDISCSMTTNATAYSECVIDAETPDFSVHLLVVERAKHPVALGIFRASSVEECSRRMIGEVELEDSIGVAVTEGSESGALQMVLMHSDEMHQRTDLVGRSSDAPVIMSMYFSQGTVRFEVDGVPLPPDEKLRDFVLVSGVDYAVGVSFVAEGGRGIFQFGELGRERLRVLTQQTRIEQIPYAAGRPFNMIDSIRSIRVTKRAELECINTKRGSVVSKEVFDSDSAHFRLEVIVRGGRRGLNGGDVSIGLCDQQPSANLAGFICGEVEIVGSLALLVRPYHVAFLCADRIYDAKSYRRFEQQHNKNKDNGGDDDNKSKSQSKSSGAEEKNESDSSSSDAANDNDDDPQSKSDTLPDDDITISIDVRHRNLSFLVNGIPFESQALAQISLRPKMRVCAGMSRRGQRLDFVVPSVVPDPVEALLLSDGAFDNSLIGQPVTRANFVEHAPVSKGVDWRYGNQNRNSYGRLLSIDEGVEKTTRTQGGTAAATTTAGGGGDHESASAHLDVVTVVWADGSKNRYRAGPAEGSIDLVYGKEPVKQRVPEFTGSWALSDSWQSQDVSVCSGVVCRYTCPAATYSKQVFRPRNHPVRADMLLLAGGTHFCGLGIVRSTERDLQLCSESNVGDLPESIACGVADNRLVMRRGGDRLKIGVQPQITFPMHISMRTNSIGNIFFFVNDVEIDCSALEGERIADETEYRVAVSLSELGDRCFFAPGPNFEAQIRYVQLLPHDMWKPGGESSSSSSGGGNTNNNNNNNNSDQDHGNASPDDGEAAGRRSPPGSSTAITAAHRPPEHQATVLAHAKGPDAEMSFCAAAAPRFLHVSEDSKSVKHSGPIAAIGPAPPLPHTAREKKIREQDEHNVHQDPRAGLDAGGRTNSEHNVYQDPLAGLGEGEVLHPPPAGAAAAASSETPSKSEAHDTQEADAAAAASQSCSGRGSAVSQKVFQLGSDTFTATFTIERGLAGGDLSIGVLNNMASGARDFLVGETGCLGSLSLLLRPAAAAAAGDDETTLATGAGARDSTAASSPRLAILYEDKIIDETAAPFFSDNGEEPIVVMMHARQQKIAFSVNGRPFESDALAGINFKGEFRVGVGLTTEGQHVVLS